MVLNFIFEVTSVMLKTWSIKKTSDFSLKLLLIIFSKDCSNLKEI